MTVPVVWNYDYEMLIGHGQLSEDGQSLVITITDQRVIDRLKPDAITLVPTPVQPKAAPIRVLRVLEYVYDDAVSAEQDMARWTHAAPVGNQRMRMRSATLPFETLPMAEPQPLHKMYPENRQDPKPQPSPWKFGRHPGWGGHGVGCGTGRCCPGELRDD